jgi:hypothetical protein
MRSLLLALLLLPPPQESIPPEWLDLLAPASGIDPDDRDAARATLEKLAGPSRDILRKLAKEEDRAAILLGLLGDSSSRLTLCRLAKGEDALLRRAAAEALGLCPGDSGVSDLASRLEDDDPAVALACARALGRMKAKGAARELAKAMEGKSERKALIAAHGLETAEPGSQRTFIRMRLTSAALRELAYMVATNAPSVIEELKRAIDKQGKRNDELKLVLEKDDLSPAARDALGTLCVRAGMLNPADVLAYLAWPPGKATAWARERAPRLKQMRRCALAYDLVRRIEERAKSTEPDGDEAKHVEALEGILQSLGARREEGDLAERAKAYRAWHDRAWTTLVDGDVVKAIDDGVAWLKARQEKDGSWLWCKCGFEAYANIHHAEGQTALCGYTLLKMDVPFDDPVVVKAANHLLNLPVEKVTDDPTYSLSLQAMFLGEMLGQMKTAKKDRKTKAVDAALQGRAQKRIQECVDWLVGARVTIEKGGYEQFAWTYTKPLAAGAGHDHSNTQFAILGLLAGQNAGAKVPLKVWQGAFNHWKGTQYEEGGWYYTPFPENTPKTSLVGSTSMTGAGIASVLVTEAALKGVATEKVASTEEAIRKALAKWEKTYPIPAPARYAAQGHVFSVYYDLYSVERGMMLGGLTRIGGKDWYHDGALYILWNQMHDGAWLDTSDTCFALLFLKKAYIPVATGADK